MSTPGSRRLRLALSAIGAIALVYAAVTLGLQAAASHVEASGIAYPYKQEDWLRYLLPSLWPTDDKPLLLLAGPSTVRENLLFEEFAAAFPEYRVYNGGISSGTLADMMAGLEYVERAYGAAALPKVMVLGLSPRFIADIPHAGRPFGLGLDKYSPHFRAPDGDPVGFGLERKGKLAGAVAKVRFLLTKQHERYVTAAEWYVAQIVSPDISSKLLTTPFMDSGWGRLVFSGRALDIGIHRFALELASPYKYRSSPNPFGDVAALLEGSEVWREVFAWNPDRDAETIKARVAALKEYAHSRGITLFVVNLPEGSLSRERFPAKSAESYLALINAAFDPLPVLNLRCLLTDDELLDTEHARPRGARKITRNSIGFVKDIALTRAADDPNSVMLKDILLKWQAIDCPDSPIREYEEYSPADRGGSARAGLESTAPTGP